MYVALSHQLINAFLGAIGPAACVTTAIMCFMYYKTYEAIWADHVRISARWPAGNAAAAYHPPQPSAAAQKVKALVASRCGRKSAKAVDAEQPKQVEEAHTKQEEPEKAVGGRFKDGTLDVVHNFQFISAAAYTPLFFFCSIVSWILTFLVWLMLFIPLFFPTTRGIILGLLGTGLISPILSSMMEKMVIKQIVNGNNIKMPRVFMYYDIAMSFSAALTAAISGTFMRLISGLITAFCKLIFFDDPVLPARFGTADAGLSAYGALMKCRYMCIFDELGLSSTELEYKPSEEWLEVHNGGDDEQDPVPLGWQPTMITSEAGLRGAPEGAAGEAPPAAHN